MGYPPELKFAKAPLVPEARISLKAHDVILNALLGHLLGNLSYRNYLRDPRTGKPDALGISLPDDFAILHNAKPIKSIPIDFDDRQPVDLMIYAYDAVCHCNDPYSMNHFEKTLQELLHAHALIS